MKTLNFHFCVLYVFIAFLSLNYVHAQNLFGKWNCCYVDGQDSIDINNVFRTYSVPEGYPYMEEKSPFNVSVNHSCVGIYTDKNFCGKCVSFASFDFKTSLKEPSLFLIALKSSLILLEETSPP